MIRLLTRERQRGERKNLGSLFVDVKACSSQTHSKTTSDILYNVLLFISVIETNWSCSLTYLQAWLHANVVGPEGVSVYLVGHTDFENETEEIYKLDFVQTLLDLRVFLWIKSATWILKTNLNHYFSCHSNKIKLYNLDREFVNTFFTFYLFFFNFDREIF